MAKPIEEQSMKTLRAAAKALNGSDLLPDEPKIKMVGVKMEALVDKLVDIIDNKIPEDATLPKDAADWFNWHFADEFGTGDENEEDTQTVNEEETVQETAQEEEDQTGSQASGEEEGGDAQTDLQQTEGQTEEVVRTGDEQTDAGTTATPDGSDDVGPGALCNTKQVLDLLKLAKSGLAKTSLIEDRLRAVFTGDQIRTYNGHICITQPFFTDFNCSVRVDDLLNVLSKVDASAFTMDLIIKDEIGYLHITTKDGLDAGFNTVTEASFADRAEDINFEGNWYPLPENFLEGMALVRTSADRTSFGSLSCVYINGDVLVSTDRSRISHFQMQDNMGAYLVRADVVDELIKFNVKEYMFDEEWLHFRTKDGSTFSTRPIQGQFVNYEKNVEAAIEAVDLCEIPATLVKDIKSVSVMGEFVEITLENGKLWLTSSGNRGWVSKTIEVEHSQDIKMKINPGMLMAALKQGVVTMAALPNLAVILRTDDFTHCIAMLR